MSEQAPLEGQILTSIGDAVKPAMIKERDRAKSEGFEDFPGFEGWKEHVVSRRLGGFVESVVNDPRNKGGLSIWAVALFFNQADPDLVLLQTWDRKEVGTLVGILQKKAEEVFGKEEAGKIENIWGADGRFDPKILKVDVFGIAAEAIEALRKEKLLPEPLREELEREKRLTTELESANKEYQDMIANLREENSRLSRGAKVIKAVKVKEESEAVEPVEPVKPREAELELPDWLKALQEAPSRAAEQKKPAETVEMAAAPLPKQEAPKPVQVDSVEGIARQLKEKGGAAEVKFGPQVLRSVVEATFARIIKEQAGKGPKPTVNINEFRVDSGMQLSGNIQVAGRIIPVSLQLGPALNYIRHTVGNIPTIPLLFNTKQRDELLRTVEERLQRVRHEIYLTIKGQMPTDVNLTDMIDPRIEGQDMIATFRGRPISR